MESNVEVPLHPGVAAARDLLPIWGAVLREGRRWQPDQTAAVIEAVRELWVQLAKARCS